MKPDAKYTPRPAGKPVTLDRQLASLRYSPDGNLLAAGDFEGQLRRWDASGAALAPLPHLGGHHGWVQGLAFHPDGKLLFSADSWGKLCAWPNALKEPKPAWSVEKAHDAWVRQLAVSPDGKALASCASDGTVCLWSPDKGERRGQWKHPLDLLSLTFAPDGKSLLFGDLKGAIHRRELTTGKVVQTYDAKGLYRLDRIQDVGGVRRLAFDPSGKTLAAAGCAPTTGGFVQGAPVIVYFEADTGKVVQSLTAGNANEGFVHDLHWHKDGFVMAVTSGQPGQGKLLFHRPGAAAPFFVAGRMANCHALAAHPAGRRLVVSATNANSAGNGRPLTKERQYPGNWSPLHIWEMPES